MQILKAWLNRIDGFELQPGESGLWTQFEQISTFDHGKRFVEASHLNARLAPTGEIYWQRFYPRTISSNRVFKIQWRRQERRGPKLERVFALARMMGEGL